MTRYRPSDALIAALAEVLPEDTGSQMDPRVGMWLLGFDLPGVGRIRIQKEALVEVEEPLPPEPPYLSIANFGEEGPFIRRTNQRWQNLGGYDFDYADLCRFGPPVLLVPDPLTEAPELPWEGPSEAGRRIGVHLDGDVYDPPLARITIDGRDMLSLAGDRTRQMGLALLRAAAQQQEDRAQQEEKT